MRYKDWNIYKCLLHYWHLCFMVLSIKLLIIKIHMMLIVYYIPPLESFYEEPFMIKTIWIVPVYKWCKEFKNIRTKVHDDFRCGRPSILTDDIVKKVSRMRFVMIANWLLMNLLQCFRNSQGLCCSKQSQKHLDFINCAQDGSQNSLLNNTHWIKCKPPKSFWNAMNWMVIIFSTLLLLEMKLGLHTICLKQRNNPNSGVTPVDPQPKNSKPPFRPKQIMTSVFWDHEGIILIKYLPQGRPSTGGTGTVDKWTKKVAEEFYKAGIKK